MSTYGLLEHFEDVTNPQKYKDHEPYTGKVNYINKSLFKDKKLNKLWEKAESSGFTRKVASKIHFIKIFKGSIAIYTIQSAIYLLYITPQIDIHFHNLLYCDTICGV